MLEQAWKETRSITEQERADYIKKVEAYSEKAPRSKDEGIRKRKASISIKKSSSSGDQEALAAWEFHPNEEYWSAEVR